MTTEETPAAGAARPPHEPSEDGVSAADRPNRTRAIALVLGPGLFLATFVTSPPGTLVPEAWHVAGLAAWMATWWIGEVIPLGATGLLPIPIIPLIGAGTQAAATAPYASPTIFLFLGGFVLAIGIQRWRLHERIAYHLAVRIGTTPPRIVGGFMLATAGLSMWMSNTAAVLIMLPMAVSVVALLPEGDPARRRFGTLLLLAIAYAGSIGGLATLIGTPPNAFLAAFSADTLGQPISFATWMLWALPLTAIGLISTWALLVFVLIPMRTSKLDGARELAHGRLASLGPIGAPTRRVALVWALVATAWLARPLIPQGFPYPSDAAAAILGALALFLLPSGSRDTPGPLLRWDDTKRLPWGALLLFGGGLSLAGAMERTGLAHAIGQAIAVFADGPLWLLILIVVLVSLVVTELMSNTAAAAILLPVLFGLATSLDMDPRILLVPAALMSSCGFMMPAGTPPNTLAIGTGLVRVPDMVRHGFWLNLLFVALVTVHGVIMARYVF